MKHLNNWMRALRRSVLCACVAVACVWCLPSCNDDKIGDISLIYGRWEATSFSGYEKEEGEEPYEWNYGPSEMAGDYVIFNTDGTYVEGSSGTTGDSGTWRIEGNRIYVTSDGETIGATIRTLSSTELVIEMRYSEPGYEYFERSSYPKAD